MSLPSHFTLNTGAKIPAVGFGTWQAPNDEVVQAVKTALKTGYRHVDAAAIYRNEAAVGEGIRQSGVPRSDIFITGKLWNTKHDPKDVEGALDKTLKDLGTDYLDLFLIHWPVAFESSDKWFPIDEQGVFKLADIDPAVTYTALEKLLETGKVRAIGVCNFTVNKLNDLISKTKVVPAVNQIEAHPYLQQPELMEFCRSKNILIEAYSPLGNNQTGEPKVVDDSGVKEVASQQGLDAAQLVLSWGIQRGTVVLSKSVTPSRIESNFKVVKLPDEVFQRVTALERHKRFNVQARWGYDIFEEIGESEVKEIARDAGPENLTKFNV
ncbi:putative aldehyde reductase i [Diaporthe ampelina]|uniref:Putative aldehyde reductase i n=1 Tax=Diaporthe ampelina TaxID=1214573 RepID=A0A0G2FYY7_9PEZI|nr:putative aldehyde reductase i [Diaporthe ampelina]